jgi:hypothetical protein
LASPQADPDGDLIETVLWLDPETLPGNPAVRPELLASVDDVMAALGCAPDDGEPSPGDESTCPCGMPAVYDEGNGWQHGDGSVSHEDGESVSAKMATVAKAVSAGPKGWPGWKLDLKTAAHWAPKVRASVTSALPPAKARDLSRDYLAAHPQQQGDAPGKRDRNKQAHAWLAGWMTDHGVTLVPQDQARGIAADGVLIGAASGQAATDGGEHADTGGWEPGDEDTATRRVGELGLAALLLPGGSGAAEASAEAASEGIESGYLWSLAVILAGTDADWAESQGTLDELGGILSDALASDDLAVTLVGTEINIWTGLAAQEYYLANTTSLLQWVAVQDSRTCPICLQNAAAGPRRASVEWPSGHVSPPAHPGGCRCARVPVGV